MSHTQIPESKATNAYDLLGEVKELILAEPLRYNQRIVRIQGEALDRSEFAKPACGTVGCIAGWVVTLKAPTEKVPTWGLIGMMLAADILGLQYEVGAEDSIFGQAWELFSDVQEDYDEDGDEIPTVAGKPQSAAHARSGADHIERFRQMYADQLKAKRV